MPLAAHVGAVAVRLQHLRDRHAAVVEVAGVALGARVVGEDADAGLVRVQAGQQRGAARAAARRVVERAEAQPVARPGGRGSASSPRRRSSRGRSSPCRR